MILLASRFVRRRHYTIMRAVFDSRFFEEAWPTISRGLESPRIVLVATK
jgi:hypothetical protein